MSDDLPAAEQGDENREARLDMPPRDTVLSGAWGEWIAETDDRMTGTCT
jgi:hypothetical protein